MEQNERNKNLSLKKKLFISHGIIIATAAVIAVLLLVGLNIVKGNVSGIFNGPLANIDSVGKVRYGITDLQRAINRILTEDSSQVGNSYVNFEKTVTEDVSLITDSVQQMQNRKMNTESTALLNQIASKIDEGEKVRSTLMTQIKAGRYSEAVELNNNTYLPIVNDIKSLSEQLENSIDKTAVNYYTMSKYTGVGMTVAGILLLIADVVFGLRVTRKMASAIVEPVQEITIVPRTMGALGYVMQTPEEEKFLNTKAELEAMLVTALAGRAAEELVFDTVTTGASNDIEQATKIARAMVTMYGMSDKFGMMCLATVENQYLDGRAGLICGEDTAGMIDEEVLDIINHSYDEAMRMLTENREILDHISEYLYEKETITGKEFMKIFREMKGLPEPEETEGHKGSGLNPADNEVPDTQPTISPVNNDDMFED